MIKQINLLWAIVALLDSSSMTPAKETTRIAIKCSPQLEGLYPEFSNSYPSEFPYVCIQMIISLERPIRDHPPIKESASLGIAIRWGTMKDTLIVCKHANTAVHCTKASVFGDKNKYDAINAESDPNRCVELGRQCTNFSDKKWLSLVEDIATDVLFEQFKHDDRLAHLLLSTGNAEIVNVRNMQVWGIGPDSHGKNSSNSAANLEGSWPGTNIQGKSSHVCLGFSQCTGELEVYEQIISL